MFPSVSFAVPVKVLGHSATVGSVPELPFLMQARARSLVKQKVSVPPELMLRWA